MRFLPLIFLFIFVTAPLQAQQQLFGKVINASTGDPMAFVQIRTANDEIYLSAVSGEFAIPVSGNTRRLTITYPGFSPRVINVGSQVKFQNVALTPSPVEFKKLYFRQEAANVIRKAIQNKPQNDPREALQFFEFKSYNKLIIDKQSNLIPAIIDTAAISTEKSGMVPRSFLSEKIAHHLYENPQSTQIVEGFSTAGFDDPVYELLKLNLEPPSLYDTRYKIYETTYAGPLGDKAFKNYHYQIIDTVSDLDRPAYRVHFKPRRPGTVAGMEGLLYLDTTSFAIQKAHLYFSGGVKAEVEHTYTHFNDQDIWFPVNNKVTLMPGTGDGDIALLAGIFTLGTVQREQSLINTILAMDEIAEGLALTSSTTHYDIILDEPVDVSRFSANINVVNDAHQRSPNFWEANRQEPFTAADYIAEFPVREIIQTRNILKLIEIRDALISGFFPVGPVDIDLGRFINYNVYEGIRLGVGGETNQHFSRKFRLDGYTAYGFGDDAFKYRVGGGYLLNNRTRTWLNLNYQQEIREVGSTEYIRGLTDFAIIRPRIPNINYHYTFNRIATSIQHRVTPRFHTEIMVSRSDITQIHQYAFHHENRLYRDYTISQAKFGFLWRPFSEYLSTPNGMDVFYSGFPVITGQLDRGVAGLLGGDFDFTKLSLKVDYQIDRLDKSFTQIAIEGNYGIGTIPLTHAFHASPNNPNRETVLQRFAIAGINSFETMYFNEFYSDRQAAVHILHQLRPFKITGAIRPQLAFSSRHVIGNFTNRGAHQNIDFSTLQHVYNEAGIQLDQILLGFGLSAAYRYGAYHLPSFSQNFALKFTFNLQL